MSTIFAGILILFVDRDSPFEYIAAWFACVVFLGIVLIAAVGSKHYRMKFVFLSIFLFICCVLTATRGRVLRNTAIVEEIQKSGQAP